MMDAVGALSVVAVLISVVAWRRRSPPPALYTPHSIWFVIVDAKAWPEDTPVLASAPMFNAFFVDRDACEDAPGVLARITFCTDPRGDMHRDDFIRANVDDLIRKSVISGWRGHVPRASEVT